MTTKTQTTTKREKAIETLLEHGATHETKEDSFGDTKSGWWLDTVWLAPYGDPRNAIAIIEG